MVRGHKACQPPNDLIQSYQPFPSVQRVSAVEQKLPRNAKRTTLGVKLQPLFYTQVSQHNAEYTYRWNSSRWYADCAAGKFCNPGLFVSPSPPLSPWHRHLPDWTVPPLSLDSRGLLEGKKKKKKKIKFQTSSWAFFYCPLALFVSLPKLILVFFFKYPQLSRWSPAGFGTHNAATKRDLALSLNNSFCFKQRGKRGCLFLMRLQWEFRQVVTKRLHTKHSFTDGRSENKRERFKMNLLLVSSFRRPSEVNSSPCD